MRATVALCAVLAVQLEFAFAAYATFPGRDGRIATQTCFQGGCDLDLLASDGHGDPGFTDRVATGGCSDRCENVVFSPDGRRIAFSDFRRGAVYWMRADASGERHLVGRGRSPAWSPDGRQIVLERNGALYVKPLAGSSSRRIGAGSEPAWSARGEIAFDGGDGIYAMRPDGSGVHLLAGGEATEWPNWSPDGRRLVFQQDYINGVRLRFVNRDGTHLTTLHGVEGDYPVWSPDGRAVAFHGEHADALYVIPVGAIRFGRPTKHRGGEFDIPTDWQPLPRRGR